MQGLWWMRGLAAMSVIVMVAGNAVPAHAGEGSGGYMRWAQSPGSTQYRSPYRDYPSFYADPPPTPHYYRIPQYRPPDPPAYPFNKPYVPPHSEYNHSQQPGWYTPGQRRSRQYGW